MRLSAKRGQEISIFVQCSGGPKAGKTEKLQSAWDTQWDENGIAAIPRGYTASLILSSTLVNDVILKLGCEASGWTIENKTQDSDAFNILSCRTSTHWGVPAQDIKYGLTSNFYVDGFDISLNDYPLTLTIKQEDLLEQLNIYVWWEIK